MKEEPRTAVRPEHEFEHAEPTVIHDPDQDLTILARWLRRGMEQGPRFWFLLAGAVGVAVLVGVLAGGLSKGRTTSGQAWADLSGAQTPGQKVEVAEAFPAGEVSRVAKLQAAADHFLQAIRDLPANRESALPQLKKALDLYQQVAREAPKGSDEATAAAFGAARALEARNELPEAIGAYKAVIAAAPDSAEARQAAKLVEQLKDPEVVAFYKDMYTYKAPTASLPTSLPEVGDLPAGHPSLSGPTIPAPALPSPAGLDLTRPATAPAIDALGPGPLDIAPPPASTSPAKAETPATKKDDLPADPFAPDAPRPKP